MKNEKKPLLILRDDGFSQFYTPANPETLTPEEFLRMNCDFLEAYPEVDIKEMGVGPGSTFTYNTRIGEFPLYDDSPEALSVAREGDLRLRRHLLHLKSLGVDGMGLASKRIHELGRKFWVRLEMNHEYTVGHATWHTLVGSFNKSRPDLWISERENNFDFKHKEVRDFRLAIVREAAEHDIDAMSFDFCVYPPFFADPENDGHYMTEFLRDARALLDEFEARLGHAIEIAVRLPYNGEKMLGLRWRDWVDNGLIDYVIPSIRLINERHDIDITPFVDECRGTKTRVIGCIRPFMGTVSTDHQKGDRYKRLERPLHDRITYAKALGLLRQGADGIQVAIGTGGLGDTVDIDPDTSRRRDGWRHLYAKMTDISYLERMDKEYIFTNEGQLPVTFDDLKKSSCHTVRIADSPENICRATLRFKCRKTAAGETICIKINGKHELVLTDKELSRAKDGFIFMPNSSGTIPRNVQREQDIFSIERWWENGVHYIDIPRGWFKYWENTITFEHNGKPLTLGEVSIILNIR